MIPTIKYTTTHIRCLLLLVLLMGGGNLFGQQYNLVPNPSFEQYTNCPDNSTLQSTKSSTPNIWFKPDNRGAGYFNICAASNNAGVPTNLIPGGVSYQPARTGNAYIAMFYFGGVNYFEVKLNDSLISGEYYYGEYFVNLNNTSEVACNNQSMLFTKNTVYVDTVHYDTLLRNPQITNYDNPIIADTVNWVKVSGIFKAQGGEQYLTLGNFRHLLNDTKRILFQTTGFGNAGYYVDDVAVYDLDSFNLKADAGRDTTITTGDSAFIGSLTNGIDSLKWQLLNTNGTIDSIRPGFWVHPLVNTCYVLTQTVNGFTSSDTVCVTVQPLPLKIINYELLMINEHTPNPSQEGNVENRWTTANEINVSHFYVQRSINSKDFITIHKEQAKNQTLNNYSFIDNETRNEKQETLFYRIVSIDKDGKTSFSEVREIRLNQLTDKPINVFPNPAKDFFSVVGKDIKEIQIINQLGQVVYREIATGTNLGNDAVTINTQNFSKGLYVVKIVMKSGEVRNEKLIIQ